MLNNINIQGRITKDIEIKTTPSGKKVCSFTIACGQKIGQEERTSFLDCVAWEKRAEFIANYFPKGTMILLSGRLETRSYQDSNGNNRKVTEIVVNEVNFCGDKKASSADDNFQPVPVPPNSQAAKMAGENEAAILQAEADAEEAAEMLPFDIC